MKTRKNFPSRVKRRRLKALETLEKQINYNNLTDPKNIITLNTIKRLKEKLGL